MGKGAGGCIQIFAKIFCRNTNGIGQKARILRDFLAFNCGSFAIHEVTNGDGTLAPLPSTYQV
jgi:hypothetical protein